MITPMADENRPPHDVEHNRRYLEKLLADCRRNEWPGGERLVGLIERALAELPRLSGAGVDDRAEGEGHRGAGYPESDDSGVDDRVGDRPSRRSASSNGRHEE
jgi:hypothetical protein